MKPEEARFILAAVRPSPGSADATPATTEDPNIAKAFRVMESDAELKAWYNEHCIFDRAVADQISAIDPPSDLESNILAGLKVSGLIPWWQRGTFRVLAVAASIMLIAAVGKMALQPSPSPDTGSGLVAENTKDFRRSVVGEIKNLQNFDHMSDQSSKLVAWLNQQGAPTLADLNLPSNLGNAEVAGCKLLQWKGHSVSLMCFLAADSAGETHSFHLVVIDEKALPDIAGNQPLIASEAGWLTALWRQGSKVAMLVTDNPDLNELRKQRQSIMFTQVSSQLQKSKLFRNKPSPLRLSPSKRSVAA